MPEVSVIVPVYNVERYLNRCVDSILKQTFKDVELILVDDGSSDNGGKLCDKYAKKDGRIKVIHKQNGGVSAARNDGLDIACGKYVMFVDSDDWLPKKAIELLVISIKKSDADFCCGSALSIGVINNTLLTSDNCEIVKKTQTQQYLSYIKQIKFGAWAKLYKLDIIKQCDIRFPDGVKFSEDAIFLYTYLAHSEVFCSVNELVYYYNRTNETSAMSKYYSEINLWMAKSAKAFENIFPKKTEEVTEYILERQLLMFELCIRHHIWISDFCDIQRKEQFLKNAYCEFKASFDELPKYRLSQFDAYVEFINNNDFEGLCDYIEKQQPAKQNLSWIKNGLRKTVISLKSFLIFKLRLFYK